MPKGFRKAAREIMMKHLDRLNRLEKTEFVLMGREWQRLSKETKLLIDGLLARGTLSKNQIFMLGTFREFQQQYAILNARYADYNTALISRMQHEYGSAGIRASEEILNLSAKFYTHVPVQAVNAMVGMTTSGTPLHDLLILRYGENAEKVSNILVNSMALGLNPLETARLIGPAFDGGMAKSIQIARTEQMNVLREVQTLSYQISGLVVGVDVIAEPDACELCLAAEDDNPHELGYVLDIHPNCRCSLGPVLGD